MKSINKTNKSQEIYVFFIQRDTAPSLLLSFITSGHFTVVTEVAQFFTLAILYTK